MGAMERKSVYNSHKEMNDNHRSYATIESLDIIRKRKALYSFYEEL